MLGGRLEHGGGRRKRSNENGFLIDGMDVSALDGNGTVVVNYQGPPMLTIQTCTGSLNEWRTLFKFSFVKVVQ